MNIRLSDAWDGAALGYDAWKMDMGDDYEPEFFCDACNDIGWLLCEDCNLEQPMVIPCTECSAEVELWDLDDE